MQFKLPRFIRSDFFKNVFTLISGTTLAQIISLAIYPILTNWLYTPDDFGVFALYMSIITITAIMASAKYELAIMLPEKDKDSVNLVGLSMLISFGTSFLLLIIVILFNKQISSLLGNEKISFWLYFVPLSTLLNGLYQSLNYWSNRNKRFRNITAANLGQSLTNSSVKLGIRAGIKGPAGLIAGTILGQLAGFFIFGSSAAKNDLPKTKWVKFSEIRKMAGKYILFPKYNMLHGVTNNLSGNLPVFLLSSYFSSGIVGLYALAFTMIFRPMNLITTAFSQVFSQRIIEKQNKNQLILPDIRKLLINVFQFSTGPFLLVALFAPTIFRYIFGAEWEEAGRYARILIPWLYLVFLSAPFSFIPDLLRRQKTALFIDIIKLLVRLAALITGIWQRNVYLTLLLFSMGSLAVVGYQLRWYFILARAADYKKQ